MLGHCLRRWSHMKQYWIYVFQLLNVQGTQRMQVGGVASDKEPLSSFHSWGFTRHVHLSIDIDPRSDPENPEYIRKSNCEFLKKS